MHKLYFDASAKDKKRSYAIIIKLDDEIVFKTRGEFTSSTVTINGCEYIACIIGLTCCYVLGITSLEVYGDSTAVIDFMNGKNRVNKKTASGSFGQIALLLSQKFDNIKYIWIPSKANKEADREAK